MSTVLRLRTHLAVVERAVQLTPRMRRITFAERRQDEGFTPTRPGGGGSRRARRGRREAVGGVLDAATAALVDRLRARPDVAALLAAPDTVIPTAPTAPVVDVRFALAGTTLSFFSVISTLGTPTDVTAQELRLEAFFASDEATRGAWISHG